MLLRARFYSHTRSVSWRISAITPTPTPPHLCLGRHGLHVPDTIRVFHYTAITGEESHAGHAGNALADPLVLVLVGLVDKVLGLDIAVKVVADQIIVAVVGDGVDQGRELVLVAEAAAANGVKDLGQVRVDVEMAIVVRVAEVLDVFGQVAEEENVGVTDFAGDFDLRRDS